MSTDRHGEGRPAEGRPKDQFETKTDDSVSAARAEALIYAELGYSIIPCHANVRRDDGTIVCTCGGLTPGCQGGKHPLARFARKGANSKTSDPVVIATWLVPDFQIGLVTDDKLVDIDIDLPRVAQHVLTDEELLEDHFVVRSGRDGGGAHVWAICSEPTEAGVLYDAKTGEKIGELRAPGQYGIVPPALHASGNEYEWVGQRLTALPYAREADFDGDGWTLAKELLGRYGIEVVRHKARRLSKEGTPEMPQIPEGGIVEVEVTEAAIGFEPSLTLTDAFSAKSFPEKDRSGTLFGIAKDAARAAMLAGVPDFDPLLLAGMLKRKDRIWEHASRSKYYGRSDAEVRFLVTALRAQEAVEDEEKEEAASAAADPGKYGIDEWGTFAWKHTPKEPKPYKDRLANFWATIVSDISEDDGQGTTRKVEIRGQVPGDEPTNFVLTMDDFLEMKWPLKQLGPGANPEPGTGKKDQLRSAIQWLSYQSEKPEKHRLITATGWMRMEDGWGYCSASGAITAAGLRGDVRVGLDKLASYDLPDPLEGEAVVQAIRTFLAWLDSAADHITMPLAALAFRVILGPVNFSAHLSGKTGLLKTAMVTVVQQCWGANLSEANLPANWRATANATEMLCYRAKDAIIVVDDFKPEANSKFAVEELNRKAERLFRGQANQQGRDRMKPDASLRQTMWPRGAILSTGEDMPKGLSLNARVFEIEVGPDDVDKEKLRPIQQAASGGVFAGMMAGYIHWLARDYEKLRHGLRKEVDQERDQIVLSGAHLRLPEILANLTVGWRYFTQFALLKGAISGPECEALRERLTVALMKGVSEQNELQDENDHAEKFVRLVTATISSGYAYLVDPAGSEPQNPMTFGWRLREGGSDDHPTEEWMPQGRPIGWVEGDDLYLDPEGALAVIQDFATKTGNYLPVTPRTLWGELKQAHKLKDWDEKRERNTIRVTLQGALRSVLHFSRETFGFLPDEEPSKEGDEEVEEAARPSKLWDIRADDAVSEPDPATDGRFLHVVALPPLPRKRAPKR